MSHRTRARGSRWTGAALAAALLLVGSAVPLPRRHNPDFGPLGPDKFLHGAGHAALAAALADALDAEGWRGAVLAAAVSTGYGVATERLQERIPGREFERGDVAAGLVGSVVGVCWRRRDARRGRGRGG